MLEVRESIDELKRKLKEGTLALYSLHERKVPYIELHSEEWRSIYKKFEQIAMKFLNNDPYLASQNIVPQDYLTTSEMEDIIYRTTQFFNPNVATSYSNYLSKSIIRAAIRAFESKEKHTAKALSYFEDKDYDVNEYEYDELSFDRDDLRAVNKAFELTESFYTSTKAGQKLKRNVYTYKFLDYLLDLQIEDVMQMAEKYTFINFDAVLNFSNVNNKKKVKQKDFADFTNTRTTKYSATRKQLEEYLFKNKDKIY